MDMSIIDALDIIASWAGHWMLSDAARDLPEVLDAEDARDWEAARAER